MPFAKPGGVFAESQACRPGGNGFCGFDVGCYDAGERVRKERQGFEFAPLRPEFPKRVWKVGKSAKLRLANDQELEGGTYERRERGQIRTARDV